MGLDSLVNETGYVHSKKEASDIKFDKEAWSVTIQYQPEAAYTLITRNSSTDDETIKFIIELMDEIVEDGLYVEGNLSDGQRENIEYWRNELVDRLNQDF